MPKTVNFLKSLLISLSFLVTLNACCTKRDCPENIVPIQLTNFLPQDVDTLIFTSYYPNSSFTNAIDSFSLHLNPPSSSGEYFTYREIDPTLDYKINIQSTRQTYQLTNWTIKKAPCNECFIIQDHYNVIGGYTLNGIEHTGSLVQITK